MKISKYKNAYRISPEEGDDYGVMIRYEIDGAEQWWLLCPTAASLYPGDEPDFEVCSSPSCKFDEIHQGANEVFGQLRRTPKKEGRIAELEAALAEIADAENMPSSARGVAIRALRGES